jgi:dihydroorotase
MEVVMTVKYDLIIKGGKVIDASQGLEGVRDVAFAQGKVVAVTDHIPEEEAAEVYDASGKIVTPGLVDIHTHFYNGVDALSVDPLTFLPTGVTCAVDGGSAGPAIYPGLRDLIIGPSKLHLYAFLNVMTGGMPGVLLAFDCHYRVLCMANAEKTAKIIQSNRDTIVGVKLALQLPEYDHPEDYLPLLECAVTAANKAKCPILCHIAGGFSLRILVDHLRPGDIITHCFHGRVPNIVDDLGRVRPEIREAVEKGIILDIAPAGGRNFAWDVAEAAAKDGIWPHTISTDYLRPTEYAPVKPGRTYNMPDCMSMMMGLGMPLSKVVEAATCRPAAVIGKADKHGSLKPGAVGDAAVLDVQSGKYVYRDRDREKRTFDRRIAPVMTVLGGKIWQPAEGYGARNPSNKCEVGR